MWKKLMNRIAPEVEKAAPGVEITRKHWIFLWAAAALILFCRLGVADINGSEGRWLAVADEMLKSGDFLHPTINGHAYFDKPLVSYWFIAATARLCGGVSELTARIPSALAALLALASVISLTRKFYGARTALAAGWALVSTYSFIYWGRLAEADMENAAFIIAATAWYFHCRERKSVRCYALFWSICAVGAQTKGLAAFVIPAMVAGADMLLTHKLKYHLNRRAALGLICGLAVYLIPFALEAASRGDYNASGIWLVFRENIIRAIDPWDHKDEPFWCYFLYLPRLMLPWAPVLVLALAEYIRRVVRKSATDADKWLLASIGLIFLLFSCSRSRRVYYILPAIPYCAMLCGRFLTDPGTDWAARLNRALLRIADCVLLTAPAAALAGMLILRRDLTRPVICWMTLCIVLSSVGFAVLWRRTRRTDKPRVFPAIPETARTIGIVYIIQLAAFGVILPEFQSASEFRSGRDFFRVCHRAMYDTHRIPPENLAFFRNDYSYAVFYLDLAGSAPIYQRGNRNFQAFLAKIDREGGAIFGRTDKFSELPGRLRRRFIAADGITPAPGVLKEPLNRLEEMRLRKLRKHPDRYRKQLRKISRKKHLLLIVPPPAER